MTIRYFSINNCNAKELSVKPDSNNSSMAEFMEIGEFQLALCMLQTAALFTLMTWNFSYVALAKFLISNKVCKEDIGTLDKYSVLLTTFTT
jgi:hypothetical protein